MRTQWPFLGYFYFRKFNSTELFSVRSIIFFSRLQKFYHLTGAILKQKGLKELTKEKMKKRNSNKVC